MWKTEEQARTYRSEYYAANKEALLDAQSSYAKTRLLGPAGDHVRQLRRSRVQNWRQHDPERARWHNRMQWTRRKAEMITAYGGRCACCGETAPAFLTLDHVNRDGAQHRAMFGGRGVATSLQIYADLRRRGWPQDGYRLLCMNCNFATRFGGACPHAELFASLASAANGCVTTGAL